MENTVYHKIYYQNNKEHIKRLVRDRYKNKKDIINEKIVCPFCNRTIIKRMYKKHTTTNIHLKSVGEGILRNPNEPQPQKASSLNTNGIITFR